MCFWFCGPRDENLDVGVGRADVVLLRLISGHVIEEKRARGLSGARGGRPDADSAPVAHPDVLAKRAVETLLRGADWIQAIAAREGGKKKKKVKEIKNKTKLYKQRRGGGKKEGQRN